MTIQEAYNKGLDTAENDAYEKISKAMDGLDAGPFANPKMEELRQRVLLCGKPSVNPESSFLVKFFKNEEIDKTTLSSIEIKVLELLEYCKRSVPKRPTSKHSVIMKGLIRGIEVDIIKNDDKLN